MTTLNYTVSPGGSLKGRLTIPGDKSITHRAILLASIAEGESTIHRPLKALDCMGTLKAMEQLGVKTYWKTPEILCIQGQGKNNFQSPLASLDMGNSGTSARLITGLLSGAGMTATLIGDESLSKRPMARVLTPLKSMGAAIEASTNNTLPLTLFPQKNLRGISYELPIPSAQVKSAILLAGLYAEGETTVIENIPTRDHTERMLKTFQYPVMLNNNVISLNSKSILKPTTITIPGDISSAAFFMVAATITPNSDILLENIGINPTRTGVIHILKAMGADITFLNERKEGEEPVADIRIKSAELKGITIPQEHIASAIDEFPILFIAASKATGVTILRGASELRVKESDRLASMSAGLKILGISHELYEDGIAIEGGDFQGGEVNSFGDHRIAMAFLVAGHVAKSPVLVKNCHNIETSFPHFKELASSLGVNLL